MLYIYILQSLKDKNFYVGFSTDLKDRIAYHNNGNVPSTKNRRPLKLVYYEACINQQDATRREKYLKTSWGKRYIKSRLKNYLTTSLQRMSISWLAAKRLQKKRLSWSENLELCVTSSIRARTEFQTSPNGKISISTQRQS